MGHVNKIVNTFFRYGKSPYFGFIRGHDYLTEKEIMYLERLIENPEVNIVEEFEKRFASIVGDGQAVSFAAGRMGFYVLMKILGIGPGDEVIIQAMNCGVMINAILRAGAKPVFSDIDPETFGSSVTQIERLITKNTKMIIAQHTFGIPCHIEPIVELARSRKIFLLEDSALTLGSKANGTAVGNFGDAALFSTDHTKPLNTLIGGLIYSKNHTLIKKMKEIQEDLPELPKWKQLALWKRFLFEKRYYNPATYGKAVFLDLLKNIKSRVFKNKAPFLSEDSGVIKKTHYPYPSKIPCFLAALGLYEILKWSEFLSVRKTAFNKFLNLSAKSGIKKYLPSAYLKENLDIVPLRFVWSQPEGKSIRRSISSFVDINWTLFLRPISTTLKTLEPLGYQKGMCPVAEILGEGMINIPCNLPNEEEIERMANLLHQHIFVNN